MDISISPTAIKSFASRFLRRYHVVVFVVFALGSLAIAIFSLGQVISLSDKANGYVSNQNNTSFDQATIERLRGLKNSSESTEKLNFPDGRVNPF